MTEVAALRDGSRDVDAVVQITEITKRTFNRDGEEKFLWSGQIADPTGRCRISIWDALPFDEGDLPVTVEVKGTRVRAWQGIPDITVDNAEQITVLERPPWDAEMDLTNHAVDVPLSDVVAGPSRVGMKTRGMLVSVREDSGFIKRCTECRRVLRDGACFDHGANEGTEDVRLRLVVDHEGVTAAVLVNKEASLAALGLSLEEMLAPRWKNLATSVSFSTYENFFSGATSPSQVAASLTTRGPWCSPTALRLKRTTLKCERVNSGCNGGGPDGARTYRTATCSSSAGLGIWKRNPSRERVGGIRPFLHHHQTRRQSQPNRGRRSSRTS